MALDKIEYDKQFMLHIGAWRASMGHTHSGNAVDHVSFLLDHAVELLGRFPQEAKTIRPELWKNLAVYGRDAIQGDLEARLHHEQRHPDWQYDFTENHEANDKEMPKGAGWEVNKDYHKGWTSEGTQVTHYWRRLKSEAVHDDINPFDSGFKLEPPKPVQLCEYLTWLTEFIPDGTLTIPADKPSTNESGLNLHREENMAYEMMRAVVNRPQFISKPKYFEHGVFINNAEPGLNVLHTTAYDVGESWDLICPGEKVVKGEHYWLTVLGDVEVLTQLSNFWNKTFVRVKKKDGNMGQFYRWSWFPHLNVNRHELRRKIENPWG